MAELKNAEEYGHGPGWCKVINDAVTCFEQRCHIDCDIPRHKSQMADDTSKNIQTLIHSQLWEGKGEIAEKALGKGPGGLV